MLNDKVVLITGGTGSFGKAFIRAVLKKHKPRKLIVYSRDELKQFEMRQQFDEKAYPALRYFIGDVRDRERLYRAFDGVDVVIHAAALKQVPAAEYNPMEAIKTNVLGASNVIDAAVDRKVRTVVALSTDKAVNPVNLYGATKLCSDKLFVAANNYSSANGPRFSVVRYGNVVGSRGSVIPFFLKARKTGVLPVTDKRMTRFWITLDQAVAFVLRSIDMMEGGEIFVPKIPSMSVLDLAQAVAPECKIRIVGIRPGEKLHEVMVTEDDARDTLDYPDRYVIMPASHEWNADLGRKTKDVKRCPEGFRYSSDGNKEWLGVAQLRTMIKGLVLEDAPAHAG
jgi:UDP-N-acetylglucosamine 4,6-dehydratase